jgi:hypothetical protein
MTASTSGSTARSGRIPNYIHVGPQVIRDLRQRLTGVVFDDLHGFTWVRTLIGGAADAVSRSLTQHLEIIDPSANALCPARHSQPARTARPDDTR